jgi:type VI secretion system protein ImpJ
MRYPPVNWSEGMFLLPHHFQAAEKHVHELVQTSDRWDHAYNYGLKRIEISQEAIGNFQFQINHCHARLRDGTLIIINPEQDLDRAEMKESMQELEGALKSVAADLKNSLQLEPLVRVYLGVPKFKMGASNVKSEWQENGKQRFSEVKRQLLEETRGGNEQEVALKTLNVRLLLSTDDLAGYELIPIAQVHRSDERSVHPRLDVRYIPPLIDCECWPPLGRDIIRAIFDIIGKKIEVLATQIKTRGINWGSTTPGDVDRVMMLSQLNETYATLTMLAFAQGVHPYLAYTELCRIVGKLSIFSKERRVDEIPHYDHDDLGRIFYWVKERIIALLDMIKDFEFEMQKFVGVGLGMQVTLQPKWLQSDWKWYVGVLHENINDAECRELLAPKQLDWKLGSQPQVEILFRLGKPGVRLTPLNRNPAALPVDRNWSYYEVSRDNEAWKDVQATQTLAMRLRDAEIVNRHELQGQNRIQVHFNGKRAELEFALFAVRTVQ